MRCAILGRVTKFQLQSFYSMPINIECLLQYVRVRVLKILIQEADPQSWPVVITILALVVCPSVQGPHFLKSSKTKQSENYVCYWRDCGSGRVDH